MSHWPRIVTLEDQEYRLVPVEDSLRGQPPKLRKYEDPMFKAIEDFEYTRLEDSRKRIRLLQLKSGPIDSPDIYCELVEGEYDNRFHLLTASGAPETNRSHHEIRGMNAKEIERHDLETIRALKQYEIKYEALSWCWGTDAPSHMIFIHGKDKNGQDKLYKLRVKEQLALALKYLRYPDRSRTLWIDAICINQEDSSERNHQVQMMSRIYARAEEVSIWLGDSDEASKLAIPFIKNEVMNLARSEALFNDDRYSAKWKALVMLMQRDWFSRRWVVQEIALATKATIYCGNESLEWREFAVAIERFVEVESATRRLSEVMQQDVKLRHVPGWFEYVSALGASLLVEATGKVFRHQSSEFEEDGSHHSGDNDSTILADKVRSYKNIDPLDRSRLLSLEYLVSTFFIFGASEPRDAVYSMLALSRDAVPLASSPVNTHNDQTRLLLTTCGPWLAGKPFAVDYRRPYTEFCKDFVSFAIERRRKLDPSQALDILCRPWALPAELHKSKRAEAGSRERRTRLIPERDVQKTPWRRLVRGANDAGHLEDPGRQGSLDSRSMEQYWEDSTSPNIWQPSPEWERKKQKYFPSRGSQNDEDDFPLPSWVAQVSRAPTRLHFSPGIEPRIIGRSNADPLVGNPKDDHKNYSAAQTQPLKRLQFRRRPYSKHYSLYAHGFVIDEVEEVMAASQGGNIPDSWLDMAGWDNIDKDPPSAFWRTLVADRGRDNRSPPYYYARACRESAIRGGIASGRMDTAALVNNERNPMVTEFCRRVLAVVWNRRLFKTKAGRLGLAFAVEKGDKVCILYGCTVPVVLRQHSKTHMDLVNEAEEDSVMALRRRVQEMETLRQRKAVHIERNLSPDELEKNRKYLRSANRMIKKLDWTPLAIGTGSRNGESISRDREHEISRSKRRLRSEGEDQDSEDESREGKVTQAQGHKVYSADSLGGGHKRIRLIGTRFKGPDDALLWYEFRNECYLHGMMDGEAIGERSQHWTQERVFELR